MLGTIIGDIAGSCYEFNNTSDYNFPLFTDNKEFTDDTICTVAIADAILNHKPYQSCMQEWCRRYPHPMGAYGSMFFNWVFSPDPEPYNSFGNGSAMRVAPVAWLFDNENDVRKHAEQSAAITHNHPEGIKGAVAIATAIFRLRTAGHKSPKILTATAKEFYGEQAFDSMPARGVFDVTCQGCVPLALYLTARSTGFEDAIRQAISYGGDTDTVGAIVGSLAEAMHGIPEQMAATAKSYLTDDIAAIVNQFERKRL